jgi:hypothetical protein
MVYLTHTPDNRCRTSYRRLYQCVSWGGRAVPRIKEGGEIIPLEFYSMVIQGAFVLGILTGIAVSHLLKK